MALPVKPEIRKTIAILGAFCLFLSAIEYMIPKPMPFMRIGLTNVPLLLALDIFPFPEFAESGPRDFVGRSLEESLNVVRHLTGMKLPVLTGQEKSPNALLFLGRSFWQAIVRGGYQAAVYHIDSRRV